MNSGFITEIKPVKGFQPVNWRELLQYRDLFYFLVWRDIKALYKQSVLGFSWAIIRPLFQMAIFSIIFGSLANIPSDGVPYPIFNLTALIPWTFFSSAVSKSTTSLITGSNFLTKIYFPRLIIPIAPVLAALVDFLIAFVILIIMMFIYGIYPGINIIYLPGLILLLIFSAAGIGLWLSALAVLYRDIKHAMEFIMRLLMYASPIVWPVSLITDKFPENAQLIRILYGLYPISGIVEGFRSVFLNTNPMPVDMLLAGTFGTCVVFITGLFYFRRTEKIFADVV